MFRSVIPLLFAFLNLILNFICISLVPLFHVLALNAKVVLTSPYDSLWSQLTGIALEENNQSLTTIEKEVPLFHKDVSSLLIQIFYALPLNVDKGLISLLF